MMKPMRIPTLRTFSAIFVAIFITLCFVGLIYIYYTWNYYVTQKSAETMRVVQSAAATLAPNCLSQLDFNESDLAKSEYQKLKQALISVAKINPEAKFAYIMVMKGDNIYFVADSEPPSSADYSPPGDPYYDASPEYKQPFNTGQPLQTSVVQDRWGEWISILVPIKDTDNGKVIAVFGMDYKASNWNNAAIFKTLQSLAVVMVSLVLLITFYFVIKNAILFRESSLNYQAFVESSHDIVLVANAQGRVIYANKAATQKLGYSNQELLKIDILNLYPRDINRAEVVKYINDILNKKPIANSLALVTKSGSTYPIKTNMWYGNWNGKNCIYHVSQDLSQNEELLQKFFAFFENSPTLMAVSMLQDNRYSLDRIYTDVNKAFLQTLGYTKEEVVGKSPRDLNLYSDPTIQKQISDGIDKYGEIHDVILGTKTKNGKILTSNFSAIKLNIKNKSYLLTSFQDQTEITAIKNRLLTQNTELERINQIMINRELKMAELKQQIAQLQNQLITQQTKG